MSEKEEDEKMKKNCQKKNRREHTAAQVKIGQLLVYRIEHAMSWCVVVLH